MSLIGSIKFRKLSACLFFVARTTTSAFSPKSAATAAAGVRPYSVMIHNGQDNPLLDHKVAVRNPTIVQRSMSNGSGSSGEAMPAIRHINKQEMKQILMEHEEMVSSDLESPYFVLDVRTEPEVQQTGKLGPSVPTLPVQLMMPPYNALQMDDQEFEEAFGFSKPSKELTMVFSCAAGIRSVSACKLAQQAGYKSCVNYMGGANEWFYS